MRHLGHLCLALVALTFAAAPAAAECCGSPSATYTMQPVMPVATYRFEAPSTVSQVYVVNQGPLLSGPGLYSYTNTYVPSLTPPYPYVGGYAGARGYAGWRCGCSARHAYWPYTVARYADDRGYESYRSYRYRGYRVYRHHAPLAPMVRLQSNGY